MLLLHAFPKPKKAFKELTVNTNKTGTYEGLFRLVSSELFNPANFQGYFDGRSRTLCDIVWNRIFESLTGEALTDCVSMYVIPDEFYVQAMNGVFGGSFEKEVGCKPEQSQGVNIEGFLIFYRNKPNLAMLTDVFHEVGHRVYPIIKKDKTASELGANYFMFLCLEKLNTELERNGVSIPQPDFSKIAIVDVYKKTLERAQELVRTKEHYIHGVTQ
ncbi:hypothetical protein HY837_01565 [archaeon]|nr:hypothetical protein [archaeon]